MRWFGTFIAFAILVIAPPAIAGDQILFGPVPDWVERVEVPEAGESPGGALQTLLQDRQVRLAEDGREFYVETAIKVLNSQGLRGAGTLYTAWEPQFSDLTVHEAKIIRGSEEIDLLTDGSGFSVLRREASLAAYQIDGVLTGIKEIRDLRVGDILVFATSTLRRDSIEGAEPEDWMALYHDGIAERVRFRGVWPADMNVQWKATEGIDGVELFERGDIVELLYDATKVKTPLPPTGAPQRLDMLGELELSAYQSWEEISRVMAPLYRQAATLNADSPLKAEAAQIRDRFDSDEERAMAALRLVEEEVRYLAILLGEGGLTPTSADTTWAQRFGDCKAKTALLIALLNELGIEADPVAVTTYAGGALPERVPRIGAFNHVIVRAQINGKTYWMDGTRTGDRHIENLIAPAFGYGLLVTAEGSGLVEIIQEAPSRPLTESVMTVDLSNGLGAEGTVEFVQLARGDSGLALEAMFSSATRNQVEEFLFQQMPGSDWIDWQWLDYGYDDELEAYKIEMRGVGVYEWDDRRTNLGGAYLHDVADRGPGEDADAPFALAFPYYDMETTRFILPTDAAGFEFDGEDVDITAGNVHVLRKLSVENGIAEMQVVVRSLASETPADEALKAVETFDDSGASDFVVLVSPGGSGGSEVQLAGDLMFDFDSLVGSDPTPELAQAISAVVLPMLSGESEEALASLEAQIQREPDAQALRALRALVLYEDDNYADALGQARELLRQSPENRALRAIEFSALVEMNQFEEALALAQVRTAEDPDPDAKVWEYSQIAPLIGLNRFDEGLDLLQLIFDVQNSNPEQLYAEQIEEIVDAGDARQEYTRALDRRPTSAVARFLKARLQEDDRLALAQLDQAIRIAPEFQLARLARVDRNVNAGVYEAAIADLDWLIAQPDSNPGWVMTRAQAKESMGDLPGALADFNRAVEEDAESATAWNQRCWFRATNDMDADAALGDCDEALRLRTQFAPAYDSRGLVHLRRGDPAAAIADYDTSLAFREIPESYFGRGLAKQMLGDAQGAEADFKAAIELDPEIEAMYAQWGLTR